MAQEPQDQAPEENEQADATNASEETEQKLAEMQEKWLRAVASLDNERKRASQRQQTSLDNERKAILTSFLGVADSLSLALQAHEGEHNDWVEGTQGVFQLTMKILKDHGAEPVEAMGRPFDPNAHEAMGCVPTDAVPENTVVEVLQAGFQFRGQSLLRPARVMVSSRPTVAEEDTQA